MKIKISVAIFLIIIFIAGIFYFIYQNAVKNAVLYKDPKYCTSLKIDILKNNCYMTSAKTLVLYRMCSPIKDANLNSQCANQICGPVSDDTLKCANQVEADRRLHIMDATKEPAAIQDQIEIEEAKKAR